MFPPTFPHVFCSLRTGLLASIAFVLDIFPCGPISYSAYFLVCPLGGLKVASNIITLQSLGSVNAILFGERVIADVIKDLEIICVNF